MTVVRPETLIFIDYFDCIMDGMDGSITADFSMNSSNSESDTAFRTLKGESFNFRRLKREDNVWIPANHL